MPRMTKAQRAEAFRNNPQTVDTKTFLTAYLAKKSDQGWCGSPDMYVRALTSLDGQRVFADFPQWDPTLNGGAGDYDVWALNPSNPNASQTSTESLLTACEHAMADQGNEYSTHIDRLLSTVGVVYVKYEDSIVVTVRVPMSAAHLRNHVGLTPRQAVNGSHQYTLTLAVRNWLRDNAHNSDAISVEMVPDPARTEAAKAEVPAGK